MDMLTRNEFVFIALMVTSFIVTDVVYSVLFYNRVGFNSFGVALGFGKALTTIYFLGLGLAELLVAYLWVLSIKDPQGLISASDLTRQMLTIHRIYSLSLQPFCFGE